MVRNASNIHLGFQNYMQQKLVSHNQAKREGKCLFQLILLMWMEHWMLTL